VISGLPVGNCLGQLTDEIPNGVKILKFCSTGPKSYAYITDDGKEEVKAKGCPKGDAGITYALYKRMVKAQFEKIIHTFKIKLGWRRNKVESTMKRVSIEKKVQLTYDKRIIVENYRTRPYGTKRC
jgi:hypothetical protein